MGKLKLILSFAFITLCSSFCFGKQISIQVVQHCGKSETVFEQSYLIEDGLLEGFFEQGHIVTNSPAAVSFSDSDDESVWTHSLGDAYEGAAEYFAQIDVFFNPEEVSASGKLILNKVDWSVSSVRSGKKIKTSTIGNINKNVDTKDLKVLSSNLCVEINKAIISNKA